jgi:hypothetical protein
MSHCIICGAETTRPIVAALWHFRPFEWHGKSYITGNVRMFGFWGGMRASLTLYFPVINTLVNWKHRRARLGIVEIEE